MVSGAVVPGTCKENTAPVLLGTQQKVAWWVFVGVRLVSEVGGVRQGIRVVGGVGGRWL